MLIYNTTFVLALIASQYYTTWNHLTDQR
jgi:hypothetical protein